MNIPISLRPLWLALTAFVVIFSMSAIAADGTASGMPVTFQLPADGPLPRTYRVTLAIVDAKNPDWIISQFVSGGVRTVTAENGGKFTEGWDGLDDNFMPVPPGEYAVKGIFMPAREWAVDKEWHTVTPRFVTGASSWMPSPEDWQTPEPFGGDPVNSPMGDIAVGPNGVAVFYYRYLENGLNNPMFDLTKPVGHGQFVRSFNSGGAAGGTATATDGETVWSFCNEGGMKYVYRADGKAFGRSDGAQRANAFLPKGWVTSMAAWRDGEKAFVAVAQRGKIVSEKGARHVRYFESESERVDVITLHDGDNGAVLAELPLSSPQSVTVSKGVLYALHAEGAGFAVSAVHVGAGVAQGGWQRVFTVPAKIKPFDMKVDSRGRFYLSDEAANHVYQLDAKGKVLLIYGRLDVQKQGTFDPLTLMSPGKLATWLDADGNDRLLILENAGPNRIAEWGADGKLIREFLSLQTKANEGYGIDPEHPEHLYIPGHKGWLTRFRVDYEKRTWTTDAVWPLADDPRAPGLSRPRFIRANGRAYLACGGGSREGAFNVYRLGDDGWSLSASLLRVTDKDADKKQPPNYFLWHDANGNGRVDDDEMTPTELPGTLFTYHGQNWNEELSFLAMAQGGQDVWRLAPDGFDAHGNPIFKEWRKLLTDPIFVARSEGKADAVHGGNELAEKFVSDWMQTDGTQADGYYVNARGGKNFSANEGPQHKISRYVPDGKGGFQLKWRTGRTALQWNARPGELYGSLRIRKPINGLLSVIDQSRCGVLLYNEDGLYVDTVFLDGRKFSPKTAGVYPLPGEFFVGDLFSNRTNGKIYFAMGKYTPMIFEAEGWSLTENPVRPLTSMQRTVKISASQIASPPEIALSVRGGAGSAKLARFTPALGEVTFDGSMSGWESSQPVVFQADKDQSVEVRCLYQPEQLLLRWHARLPAKFEPKPLPPLARIFTHDQLADTLSFYIQGDVAAKPGAAEGRAGDVRFVFGVFNDGGTAKPVAVGMYPQWSGKTKASPQTYRTPVGEAKFAHVGAVGGAQLFHKADDDGKGFVFVAAIPRAAIPQLQQSFSGGLRTLVNFEATFAGHNKFWWANSDGSASRETYDEPTEARLYPGSWAPAEFQGLEGGVLVRNWITCGPFGGPGMEQFSWNPNGLMPGTKKNQKDAVRELCEAAKYPPDDGTVDMKAVYTGDIVKGWWPQTKANWKPATIAELDARVIMGQAAQVWYAVMWIHAPAATELEFQFQGHPQTYLRWFLNDELVPLKLTDYTNDVTGRRPVAAKSLTLRQGWNKVMMRGYCVGYSPFRAGLILNAPAETLWKLKLSATPPAAGTTNP
jgi:hypothetical protein